MATIQGAAKSFDVLSASILRINARVETVTRSMDVFQDQADNSFAVAIIDGMGDSVSRVSREYSIMAGYIKGAYIQQKELTEETEKGEDRLKKVKEACKTISDLIKKVDVDQVLSKADQFKGADQILQNTTGMRGSDLTSASQGVKNIYADNIGTDPAAVAKSMAEVNQVTGKTGPELEKLTRAGMLLNDTFGYDITESIRAAGALEQQFGITGAEAFDLIIQGAQNGLDQDSKLLNSVKQYSSAFGSMGLGAQDMFNILTNGTQNGRFSVEQLGASMDSFSRNVMSGSDSARKGFGSAGLDADAMITSMKGGGESAKEAFLTTVRALQAIEDPMQRNAAGAGLFGESWKQIGYEGVAALANMDGALTLTSDNLNMLNQTKVDTAQGALTSLSRTLDTMLAGPVSYFVDIITRNLAAFTAGLQGNGEEAQGIFGKIGTFAGNAASFFTEHWAAIEPIIWGIIAALTAFTIIMAVCNAVETISAGIKAVQTIGQFLYTAVLKKDTSAAKENMAAHAMLNTVLAMNPVILIILSILALIAILYLVVAVINEITGQSFSATGIIAGSFMVVVAVIRNVVLAVAQILLGLIGAFQNKFIAVANLLTNIFTDPFGAIIHFIGDVADLAFSIIEKIASALDTIFNTDMASVVRGWRDDAAAFFDSKADQFGNGTYEEKFEKVDYAQLLVDIGIDMERSNYGDSFNMGYDAGEGFVDQLKLGSGSIADLFNGMSTGQNPADISGIDQGIYQNTADTAANTASMAESTQLLDEDLKYMRDIAERDLINRFTTAEIRIDQTNNNNVSSAMDLDGVVNGLTSALDEAVNFMTEGAH